MHGSVRSLRRRIVTSAVGAMLAAALTVSIAAPASAYTSQVLPSASGSWDTGNGIYLQYWRTSTAGSAHHPNWRHAAQVRWNEGSVVMWSSWTWADPGFWATKSGYRYLNAMRVQY